MGIVREALEELEDRVLSPRASKSFLSKGRAHREDECEIRTAFQRDRDRIIHSKAFRRLTHKTQVFIAPEGDHYRTRLTHTLEVSQISRTVARALRLNEDLAEAIAVGHDLGHTPFGHAGEEAIDSFYSEGFKHNRQSLRVVEVLETRSGAKPGLNLTWEVRDGIVNHTGEVSPSTLEGQIVRICDRVAYINHDIDDAVRAGMLLESDLPVDAVRVLGHGRRERIDTMVKDLIRSSCDSERISMSSGVQHATDTLRSFLFEKVYIGSAAKTENQKVCDTLRMLFEFYVNHPSELEAQAGGPIAGDEVPRAAVDFIAGMTDRFAMTEFRRRLIPKAWDRY